MPQNTTNLLATLWEALPEPVKAALIGAVIAFLRTAYDDREPRWIRRGLEVLLVASIGFAAAYVAAAFEAPAGWGGSVAAVVGLFGVDQVRQWGRRLASKKLGDKPGDTP